MVAKTSANAWKLNNTSLDNIWVKEVSKEILKYFNQIEIKT